MTNVKVKTIGAVFNGQPVGSTIEISKAEAEHYGKLGYVEIVEEKPKPAPVKKESAPKKPATKAKADAKPKTKDAK